jgi:hypothetical protein
VSLMDAESDPKNERIYRGKELSLSGSGCQTKRRRVLNKSANITSSYPAG